jgi:hypothetical protein
MSAVRTRRLNLGLLSMTAVFAIAQEYFQSRDFSIFIAMDRALSLLCEVDDGQSIDRSFSH